MNAAMKFLLCGFAALTAAIASASTVEVRIEGVASARGKVRVAVCDQATFLKQCAHEAVVASRAGETVIDISNVPPGTWAVMAYHDENNNAKLDRNEMGIPMEGYGFSRNANSNYGPPSFQAAAIDVREAKVVALIDLQY